VSLLDQSLTIEKWKFGPFKKSFIKMDIDISSYIAKGLYKFNESGFYTDKWIKRSWVLVKKSQIG
jgi:hypothetical protein